MKRVNWKFEMKAHLRSHIARLTLLCVLCASAVPAGAAKLSIVAGTTSKLVQVFVQDTSSATGDGLTGLAYNTASLSGYYYREGAASAASITLATMTLGTWTSGGFVVVDGTNMPGVYQLALPNAAIAAGAKSVVVMLKGAANMAPCVLEIELTATDNQTTPLAANVTQIGGSTAAIGTDHKLILSSDTFTSGAEIQAVSTVTQLSDTERDNIVAGVWANADKTGYSLASSQTFSTSGSVGSVVGAVGSVTGNVGGNVTGSVASVTNPVTAGTVTDKTGYSLATAPPTAAAIADAVWDEAQSGHTTAGTFGLYLDAAISGVSGGGGSCDPADVAAASAAAVWDELLSGHATAGSAGAYLAATFGKLGSTTVTVQNPVASNGTLTIVQGDDYASSSSLSLTRSWSGISLVGGSVEFTAQPSATYTAGSGAATLGPVACTFTGGGTGSTIVVTIPLTADQTGGLDVSPPSNPANYTYQVRGTTSGGQKATLFLGSMTVRRQVQ